MSFHLSPLTGVPPKEQARIIREALSRSGNNVTHAAVELRISRVWLSLRMRDLGISGPHTNRRGKK